MKGFGPYAAAKVPDGKYLWTVVVLFGLLGLTGLGALLYKPLMLQYAMKRVRASGYVDEPGLRPRPGDHWLDSCLDAARGGNRRAMEFFVERALLWPGDRFGFDARDVSISRLYRAVSAQPVLFVAILDRHDDRDTRKLIEHITLSCDSADCGDRTDAIWDFPQGVEQALNRLSGSKKPEVRKVAQAALDFTRRRFARELAGAESHKAKEPAR